MGKLVVGWSKRDISTDGPGNLAGQFHARISKCVEEPLYTVALVVSDGTDSVIFLSVDTVAIRSGLLDEIRAEVKKKNPEIPAEKIFSNATHTHSAPSHGLDDGEGAGACNSYPHEGVEILSGNEYRHFIAEQASDAVCEAWEGRKDAGIAYGYGYAVVANSRRVVYFDDLSKRNNFEQSALHGLHGHAAMYGNTKDPMFSHYEAGADHYLNVLFTYDLEQNLTGAIVNVPCPSQNSENNDMVTADYWGDIRKLMKEKYGDIFILPQCAAAGDLSPRALHYKEAQSRRFRLKYGYETKELGKTQSIEEELYKRKDIAERVVAGFDEVLSWAGKEIYYDLPICHDVREVELSRRIITDEEYAFDKAAYEEAMKKEFLTEGTPEEMLYYNSRLSSERSRHHAIMNRYELQKTQPKMPMELHTVRIGEIAFASNQFELYMDYQHRIQARSPFEQTFVVQLAGTTGMGGGSYLCTERGEWGKGYSASRYCNQVSPKGGQELVEYTLEVLHELKEKE